MSSIIYVQAHNAKAYDVGLNIDYNIMNFNPSEFTGTTGGPAYRPWVYGTTGTFEPNTGLPCYIDDDTAFNALKAAAGAEVISTLNSNLGVAHFTSADVEWITEPELDTFALYMLKNPGGTNSQYLRGDGTTATFPTIPSVPVTSVFSRTGNVTAQSGDYITTQVDEGTNLYFTNTRALSTSLTGLSTGTVSAITSSDTILGALAKLQSQVTSAISGLVRTTSTISPALVGTGATGTQVSTTKDATIRVGLSESVTSSIGGAATAVVNIKICATNSATEANWTTLFTFEEDQTVTLAIALQSIQVMKGIVDFDIPAGWYWKAESSGSGTNSESILIGQQTIYGV